VSVPSPALPPPALSSRPYSDGDLPAAQAALSSWIAESGLCGLCHPGDLAHRIYDGPGAVPGLPLGDLVRLWSLGDPRSLVGVTICLRFDAVFEAFVAPGARGGPVELAVLRSAAEATRRLADGLGRTGAAVSTDAYACDAGRRTLLSELGFEEFRVWDHVTSRPLADPVPEPVVPDGFVVRPATPDDHAELAAVRNDAFGSSWTAAGFRDGVMRKPGYSPAREHVAVAPDGRVAATAVTWEDERSRLGLFEPVATRSAFRRLGLGRAVMLAGLRALRSAGMSTALVEHTADNVGAERLYGSLGFRVVHETRGYRRPVGGTGA
jgi:predicted N-acetyltransferase YhbS